jgi:hypothetical protein
VSIKRVALTRALASGPSLYLSGDLFLHRPETAEGDHQRRAQADEPADLAAGRRSGP